jgi:hypothetical protein
MELTLALAAIAGHCRINHDRDDVTVDVGSTVHPGEPIRATFSGRE